MLAQINIDKSELAEFCVQHGIIKLAFFGSVLGEHFHEGSDVDVLVEFQEGHVPGMIRLCGMERELGELIGRKVDMRTPADLSRYFRDEIVKRAVVQYAA